MTRRPTSIALAFTAGLCALVGSSCTRSSTTPAPAKPIVTAKAPAATTKPTEAKAQPIDARASADAARKSASEKTSKDAITAAKTAAEADPTQWPDAQERFLLLTPRGPLVVQITFTIDGQPVGKLRKEAVDRFMKLADSDGDGTPTWEEVSKLPPMSLGAVDSNMLKKSELLRIYDSKRNGEVDRDEGERFVARINGAGQEFTLDAMPKQGQYDSIRASLFGVVDSNSDEELDAVELAAAQEWFNRFDADENELIDRAELLAGAAPTRIRPARMNYEATDRFAPPSAVQLWDETDAAALAFTLDELYPAGDDPKQRFPLMPDLAGKLDADQSGTLSPRELSKLVGWPPHLHLAVHFGRSGKLPAGLSVVSADQQVIPKPAKVTADSVTLELDGCRLRVRVEPDPGAGQQATMLAQFRMLDKDGNGYVDADEAKQDEARLGPLFKEADADGDGKLFAAELQQFAGRQQAAEMSSVTVIVREEDDVAFTLVDTSGDGRLDRREVEHLPEQLNKLDADHDGKISRYELPRLLDVSIRRGKSAGAPTMMAPEADVKPAVDQPPWFTKMDANGDGHLSRREFLGRDEQFNKLDADGDGYISPAEAK